MKERKWTLLITAAACVFIALQACGGSGNDTDGGPGNADAGSGVQFVSNGGSGSTLRIVLDGGGNEIPVADQIEFQVIATDPAGGPLSNIRIFCETEHGIAILEPTAGGVAFEHTNANGIMSGVLAGIAPGSFMMECRAPQGFNLVTRQTYRTVGEIPEGFSGYPGAAGGNLGGGLFTDPLTEQVVLTEVLFINEGAATREGYIDNDFIVDCDPITAGNQPERFPPDSYQISVENNFDERVSLESVEFTIDLRGGGSVTSLTELAGLVVPANSEVDLRGLFTDFGEAGFTAPKYFAGTSTPAPSGTYNVTFTVRGTTVTGDSFAVTQTATIIISGFRRC